MKIALLGPAPPFRGGIVTYQAMLLRALIQRGHETFWAAFRRQYPKFLFPGSEQEGETAPWLQLENHPRFVPWSPWSWWRTYRDLREAAPAAVVIQFWIPFFAPGFFGVAGLLRRHTDIRVIFLLHNVIAHEKYPFGRFLTRLALRQGHAFIAQSEQVRRDLLEVVPEAEQRTIINAPHPVYDFGEPGSRRKSRAEARRALDLPETGRIVLCFGFIKPYKGVLHLIDAAPQLRERYGDDMRIVVVGDIYGDPEPYHERLRERDVEGFCDLVADFVPDETVEDYFLAADLVVLPYLSATQSGIVQIAYNYDRPVVTTNVGGLPEVVIDGETGFLVPPGDADALAAAIIRFFDENRAEAFAAGVAREKEKYSWDRMAKAVESAAGVAV